ncbi:MAG: LON peptidase substrate-binding domain-containing protein, partial [Calditrichia bacterium]|nr:LON peptidase substrate-binding domain-containing protein [Calditrichia bacterium]
MKNNIIHVMPIENIIMFPDMIYPLTIKNVHFISLIKKAKQEKLNIGFFTKHPRQPKKGIEIFETGVLGKILEIIKLDEEETEIIVKGIRRIKIEHIIENEPYLKTQCINVRQVHRKSAKTEALYRTIRDIYNNLYQSKINDDFLVDSIEKETDPVKGTDLIIASIETNIFNK